MVRLNPTASWDVRRFRPNIVITTADNVKGHLEATWPGRTLRLGELIVQCELPTARCVMTIQSQADLPLDPWCCVPLCARQDSSSASLRASCSRDAWPWYVVDIQ